MNVGGKYMEYKDYYNVLDIDKSATQDEIKKKYRELAKKYHPDLNKGDEKSQDKFKEINEAYEVLGDEEKRKNYDTFGSNFSHGQQFDPSQHGFGGFTYESSDINFSDLFGDLFGGAGGGAGFNMDDIFTGAAGGRRRPSKPKYEFKLGISIEEGYKGGKKDLTININGSRKNIDVNIPKGITSGKKLRVKGDKWGIDGDVYFEIDIRDDGKHRLDGLDITTILNVLPWEAVLGEEVIAETLGGRIKVNIPKGIDSNKRIKIPNRGYEDMKGKKGDLYLEIRIVNSPSLSKEELELYKQLKELSGHNPRR